MHLKSTPQTGKNANYAVVFIVLLVAWTILMLSEVFMDVREFKDQMMFIALRSARLMTAKDVAVRQWAAFHRGVYVDTSSVSPNPSLAFLPERDLTACDSRNNCKKLTLMNPAYIIRYIYERFSPPGTGARLTSNRPIRAENAPDAWEKRRWKSSGME